MFFLEPRQLFEDPRTGAITISDASSVRWGFQFHRAINDALAASRVELAARSQHAARAVSHVDGDLVRARDYPINAEGMAIDPDGNLFFGLRYPTASDGSPLIVTFASGAKHVVAPGFELDDGVVTIVPGPDDGLLRGIRDLDWLDDRLHLLVGPSEPDLVKDGAGMRQPTIEHVSVLPGSLGDRRATRTTIVRTFPDELRRIEGLAHGTTWRYIIDAPRMIALVGD